MKHAASVYINEKPPKLTVPLKEQQSVIVEDALDTKKQHFQ